MLVHTEDVLWTLFQFNKNYIKDSVATVGVTYTTLPTEPHVVAH